jgi:hypothetical protein
LRFAVSGVAVGLMLLSVLMYYSTAVVAAMLIAYMLDRQNRKRLFPYCLDRNDDDIPELPVKLSLNNVNQMQIDWRVTTTFCRFCL